MPDELVPQQIPGSRAAPAPPTCAPLTPAEVLAVVRFNLGNDHRGPVPCPRPPAAYGRAAADFPGFAEAHASLGLSLQLLGRLSEARLAYQTARQLHPTLPGLDRNLAALEAQLGQ